MTNKELGFWNNLVSGLLAEVGQAESPVARQVLVGLAGALQSAITKEIDKNLERMK